MRNNRRWIAGAVLVAVLAFFTRPTTAQPPAQPPVVQGRYQMQLVARESGTTVFVSDTHTGQVWYRSTTNQTEWADMGLPMGKGK